MTTTAERSRLAYPTRAQRLPVEWDEPCAYLEEETLTVPDDRVVWAHRLDRTPPGMIDEPALRLFVATFRRPRPHWTPPWKSAKPKGVSAIKRALAKPRVALVSPERLHGRSIRLRLINHPVWGPLQQELRIQPYAATSWWMWGVENLMSDEKAADADPYYLVGSFCLLIP